VRIALTIVGIVAILCGLAGLAYNFSGVYALVVRQYHEFDPEAPYFEHAYYVMTGICTACYMLLLFTGVQLIRRKLTWVWVFVGVQIFEVVYFFSIAFLWISAIAFPELGHSVAAATGVANGGLMLQFLILFPLWGSVLALLAKRALESPPERLLPTSNSTS